MLFLNLKINSNNCLICKWINELIGGKCTSSTNITKNGNCWGIVWIWINANYLVDFSSSVSNVNSLQFRTWLVNFCIVPVVVYLFTCIIS